MASPTEGDGAPAGPVPHSPEDPLARRTDEQRTEGARRDRPSRLIDAAVALVLLTAEAVIVVTAVILLFVVGMSRAGPSVTPESTGVQDTPVLVWVVVWGAPVVAAVGTAVYARLRMPITALVLALFTPACILLSVAWTRALLGH